MQLTLEVKANVGDRVYIPALETHVRVSEISIGLGGVCYRISYFNNGVRETPYVFADEIQPAKD